MSGENVDAWKTVYDNPMKPEVEAMRRPILDTDDKDAPCANW